MTPDRWVSLRSLTPARVALGRAGTSLPTAARLRLSADHAAARDAVHAVFDAAATVVHLTVHGHGAIHLRSAVSDRRDYLLSPDRGRRLSGPSREELARLVTPACSDDRLAIVVCDGLSPGAVAELAPTVVKAMLSELTDPWQVLPLTVVEGGRVAVGDEVAEVLRATAVVVLVGERPGLSAPRSLGAYVTYRPRVGTVDAERTCVSNIRPDGIEPSRAGADLARLVARVGVNRASGLALDALDLGEVGSGRLPAAKACEETQGSASASATGRS